LYLKNQNTLPFLQLIRWQNLLMLCMMQVLAALFLTNALNEYTHALLLAKLFMLVLATVLITASGYIINDYFDIKIDIINKPQSVVVGRKVRRQHALLWHQMLNFAGLGIGFLISKEIGFINLFAISALWFYSALFKRKAFIGNFLVAILSAMAVFIVYVLFKSGLKMVLVYAIFCFLISLIREVIKDMQDIRGDLKYGCQTLPIYWGIAKTKWFIYSLILVFAIYLGFLQIRLDNQSVKIALGMLFFPLIYLGFKLYKADKSQDFKALSNLCKYLMMLGILSMILIKF
jgi:4-hydroxybenzoate polyprenyltransferase